MGFGNYVSTYSENSHQAGSFNILMSEDKASSLNNVHKYIQFVNGKGKSGITMLYYWGLMKAQVNKG